MAKHDVHIYVTCRVKVLNVEAANHQEAMEKAEAAASFYSLLPDETSDHKNRPTTDCAIESGGYAEEVTGFLVDEVGDTEYEKSRFYDADGELQDHITRQPDQPRPKTGSTAAELTPEDIKHLKTLFTDSFSRQEVEENCLNGARHSDRSLEDIAQEFIHDDRNVQMALKLGIIDDEWLAKLDAMMKEARDARGG